MGKIRRFTDDEKRAIIADVQSRRKAGSTIQEAVKANGLQCSNYYEWVKKFKVATPGVKLKKQKRGRRIGSKNKTTLIEMPVATPTFTAPTANVAMFVGSPDSLKALYADLFGGGAS